MMFVMAAWFVGGQVISQIISTGAFEIYINDGLVFSRINSGRMPDQEILKSILRSNGISVQ